MDVRGNKWGYHEPYVHIDLAILVLFAHLIALIIHTQMATGNLEAGPKVRLIGIEKVW